MKIAIAQLNPTIGDLAGNAQQILETAQIAAEADVRLLLTPELSLCGYPPRDLLLNSSFIEAMGTQLQQLAEILPPQLAVLVGTVSINPDAANLGGKPIYNTIALLERGKIQQIFPKRLLPTYDVFDEDRYFESGNEANVIHLTTRAGVGYPNVKIGVTICEDLWNDEQFWGKKSYEVNPIAELAEQEVDLIVNLSASPYSVGKQKLREAMLHHVTTRYQLPIIYVNQVGGNDDLIFDGSSVAFSRNGDLICRIAAFKSNLGIMEFNLSQQDLSPIYEHQELITPLASSEEQEIFEALVMGVRDYAYKCGFTKAIIGLSGGIDSSLVAAIAAEALGADNVLGILMPSPYSSEHSIKDAEALVTNLGIKSEIIAIGDAMQVYDQMLANLFAGTEFGIAEENIQSRIRGNILMAIANKFGYLLLSTGNKSEMAVGYCTLYGDMNGGLAVIADVPKTRVFSICSWLNQQRDVIPHNVIIKPPSAELKPDQKDQDSLPAYDILDGILYRMINQRQSTEQIIAAGFEPVIVKKVAKLVYRSEFKRRQAPPGLKITDRAFGTGWRMPIASKW